MHTHAHIQMHQKKPEACSADLVAVLAEIVASSSQRTRNTRLGECWLHS